MTLYLQVLCFGKRQKVMRIFPTHPRGATEPQLVNQFFCFPCLDVYADREVWELYSTVLPAWSLLEEPVFAPTIINSPPLKKKTYYNNSHQEFCFVGIIYMLYLKKVHNICIYIISFWIAPYGWTLFKNRSNHDIPSICICTVIH